MGLDSCFGINPGDDVLFKLGIIDKVSIGMFSKELLAFVRPELDDLLGLQRELFYNLGKFLIEGNLEENLNSHFTKSKIAEIRIMGCSFNDKAIISIALNSAFGDLNDADKIGITKYFYFFNVGYLHKFRDFVINTYNSKTDFNDKIRFLTLISNNYYGDTNHLLDIFEAIGINYSSFYPLVVNPLRLTESNIIKTMANSGLSQDKITNYSSKRRVFNM